MKIERLSKSSYELVSHCQMAWFLQYGLGWTFPSKWKATDRGSISHTILEFLAEIKMARQNNIEKITHDAVGEINVNDELDVKNITNKIYSYYIKNSYSHQDWQDSDLKEIHKYIDVCLNHNNGKFNVLKNNIIATEQYINYEIKEDWAKLPNGNYFKLTGFIDLITKVDENTFEIVDYKTGKINDFYTQKEKTYADFNDDAQAQIYAMALADLFGCDKNYLVTVFYLKYAKPFTVSFDCEDFPIIKDRFRQKYEEIKSINRPVPNKGKHCFFCDYSKQSFKGTNVKPLIEFRNGKFSGPNYQMKICDQVDYEFGRHDINWIEKNMSKKKENKEENK